MLAEATEVGRQMAASIHRVAALYERCFPESAVIDRRYKIRRFAANGRSLSASSRP
jgi:hypothetical protein